VFSGFIPTVEGWRLDLKARRNLRAFIAHGTRDPVIEVQFGRRANELLRSGGLETEYHESDVGHQIDPAYIGDAQRFVADTLASSPEPGPAEASSE
jgi:phospholipase/carboxylesterase